jgi:hypothetical protein
LFFILLILFYKKLKKKKKKKKKKRHVPDHLKIKLKLILHFFPQDIRSFNHSSEITSTN